MTTHELVVYEREGAAGLARLADRQLAARKKHDKRVRVKAEPRVKAKAEKRASKVSAWKSVKAAVRARSGGKCEMRWLPEEGGGYCILPAASTDHFWGRAREESVESCWHLCATHDREKTENIPTRVLWLRRFYMHAFRNGYHGQMDKASDAVVLELAQHPERRTA
jgi:hypothetical protein